MTPERITEGFVNTLKISTIQRLGYILDVVLNQKLFAVKLFNESQKLKKEFFRQPLKAGTEKIGFPTDARWKIIMNTDIDIDE